jgi:Na+-driven multidrug efflux pump
MLMPSDHSAPFPPTPPPPSHILHRLTKLSVPLFIQNLLAYSTTLVAVAFVGHLNHPELLSSAVLANSLYNVTGYSLLQGLASGMESLCGQVGGMGLIGSRCLLGEGGWSCPGGGGVRE